MLLVLLALAGCAGNGTSGGAQSGDGQSGDPRSPADPTTVITNGNRFEPATIKVAPGATVTWQIKGAVPHDVTGDGWGSGAPRSSTTFEHRFEQPGTYDYRCTIHPGMNGQVIVGPA